MSSPECQSGSDGCNHAKGSSRRNRTQPLAAGQAAFDKSASNILRLGARLRNLLGIEDSGIAAGYACFLWSSLPRIGWLLLDLLPSGVGQTITMLLGAPLLLMMLTVPITDVAGIAITLLRLREPRLVAMAAAIVLYLMRGFIWPELCAANPYWSSTGSKWVYSTCQQFANAACGVVLLAVCLDKIVLQPRLPRWVRYTAYGSAFAWAAGVVAMNSDLLSRNLSTLNAPSSLSDYGRFAAPLQAVRGVGSTIILVPLALIAFIVVISLLRRREGQ